MSCGGVRKFDLTNRYDYGERLKFQNEQEIAASVTSYQTNAFYKEVHQALYFPTAVPVTGPLNVDPQGVFNDVAQAKAELTRKLESLLGPNIGAPPRRDGTPSRPAEELAISIVTDLFLGGSEQGQTNILLLNRNWTDVAAELRTKTRVDKDVIVRTLRVLLINKFGTNMWLKHKTCM